MIGVFTLITTLRESKSVELRQEAEKQQRELDVLKIKEQQQRDDMNAKEIRMQNIIDRSERQYQSDKSGNNICSCKNSIDIRTNRSKTEMVFN
jgi:hypothetical protein